LRGCKRITPSSQLAELDSKIASAAERVTALEVAVFEAFTARVTEHVETIREMAASLSQLDVQAGWAVWANENKAVRPVMKDASDFEIKGGRHPVVEDALRKSGAPAFTANDCALSSKGKTAPRLTLITGLDFYDRDDRNGRDFKSGDRT